MTYLIIVPLISVLIYGLSIFKRPSLKNKIYFGIFGTVVLLIAFFVLKNFLQVVDILFILLVVETIVLFGLLRLENRVPILFILFFVISIGLLVIMNYRFSGLDVYIGFVIALFFFLAENNQIFLKKSYEQAATEYQNKILENQVKEVQNIYTTMRGWRHDYHNHLQKIKAHIMLNQFTEVKKYLNELEIDLNNVNQLVETGHIHLDAILNSKLSIAKNNNIDLNYKAIVPKKLLISDIDLCVLIGNLIDNAVEACTKTDDDSTKFIRLYIGVFKKQLYISVTNSTNEVIRKLDEEYITTKRGNHGHGLKRINNIVSKYNGFINRQNEPGVFVTEVLLPL